MNHLVLEKPKLPPINMSYRKLIVALEKKVWELPGAISGDELPLKHSFAEGVYMRELTIPKGMIVVGKLHRDSYVNCFMQGDMTILTSTEIKRVKAPMSFVSPAETQRFGYAHEEVKWVTVHPNPTNSTDIDMLEKEIHADSYNDLSRKVIEVPGGEECLVIDKVFRKFIDHVLMADNVFDPSIFRAITKRVFDSEKPGLWSDWTKEQQEIYMSGDWEAFSKSRGYTEEEIADLRMWIYMKERAEALGHTPLISIHDLSIDVVRRSMAHDKYGEMYKSSHIPSSKKIPYKHRRLV